MLNARTWHWLIVTAYVMFPATLAAWLLPDDSPFIWPSIVGSLWGCIVCGIGAILGLLMVCGKLRMGCPECNSKSHVRGGDREVLCLSCPKCGELRIRVGRILGLQVVKVGTEEEGFEGSEGPKVGRTINQSPFLAPTRYQLSFAILYLPVLASITAASVIHGFNPLYLLFPGFICYVLAGLLLDGLYTGFIRGKRKNLSRAKTPIRYWWAILVSSFGYCLGAYFPVGYALQERDKGRAAATQRQGELEPVERK